MEKTHPVREAIVVNPVVMSSRLSSYIYNFKHNTCVFRLYLCAWHDWEEVKGRGSLGPVSIHGNRCCRVLGDWRS